MKIKVDKETDTLYFRLTDAPIVESEEIRQGIVFDYDSKSRLIGIELLNILEHVPKDDLSSILFEIVQ